LKKILFMLRDADNQSSLLKRIGKLSGTIKKRELIPINYPSSDETTKPISSA